MQVRIPRLVDSHLGSADNEKVHCVRSGNAGSVLYTEIRIYGLTHYRTITRQQNRLHNLLQSKGHTGMYQTHAGSDLSDAAGGGRRRRWRPMSQT